MTLLSSSGFSGSQSSPSLSPSDSACSPSGSASSATSSPAVKAGEIDIEAVISLVSSLHNYERQLAGLFAAGNQLAVAASTAQTSLTRELGYLGGHQVISSVSEAQALIGQAMSKTAAGHRQISRIGATLGYRLDDGNDFGDGRKDPSSVMGVLVSLVSRGASN